MQLSVTITGRTFKNEVRKDFIDLSHSVDGFLNAIPHKTIPPFVTALEDHKVVVSHPSLKEEHKESLQRHMQKFFDLLAERGPGMDTSDLNRLLDQIRDQPRASQTTLGDGT